MKTPVGIFAAWILLVVSFSGCAGPGAPADDKGIPPRAALGSIAPGQADPAGQRPDLPDLPDLSTSCDLSDYLVYAALRNPGLEAAFGRWKAALAQVPQVGSLPDPRFNYRYFIHEIETRVGPQRQVLELTQTFPWFGKLELRADVAAQAARAARQDYEAAKQKLFFEVKDAYYEYAYQAKAAAITRENVNLLQHLEQVALIRYQTAAVGHPDVIRIQVERGKLEDQLLSLEDMQQPLAARLNAVLNRPISDPLCRQPEISLESVSAADQQWFDGFLQTNPRLRALDCEIEKQKHAVRLAQKDHFPDLTVGVSYIDTAGTIGPVSPPDEGRDPIAAVLSINLPIWRAKYDAAVRQARYRYHTALHERAEQANRIAAEMQLTWFYLRDAERKIELYQNALLPKAVESLKVTEQSFRAGKGDFTDLIDAQRLYLEFDLSRARARSDYARNRAKLEMLAGTRTVAGENVPSRENALHRHIDPLNEGQSGPLPEIPQD